MFPVNASLLLRAMIAHPTPPVMLLQDLVCANLVFPARVMLVLFTKSAVPRLSWKEQLFSSVCCVDCRSRATLTMPGELPGRIATYLLVHKVKAKESIFNSTILVKLRPTDPLQTIVARLSEEDSPCMVNPATLATVIFVSRAWSPGKNTIVVLEVKYSSASCAYSESVVQLIEL